MDKTKRKYARLLTEYHRASNEQDLKALSTVLLLLEDFERAYCKLFGFSALMVLMDEMQEQGIYIH
ncbi:hypothetical protein WAZ07_04310 [Bacillus sp. FJAT-51639]|uniref:Uncharacterized protein n=1 Tax=Bacillus bruguierae TaxID=3127667 RepID=A0ABU8FCZ6_9BACI